jgi:hypothetical protein
VGTRLTELLFASADGIEQTATRIGSAVGLVFEWHDSSFRGGDYLLAGDWRTFGSEQVIVQLNDDMGERAEDVNAPTLVYVEATRRADELIDRFTTQSLVLVRREEWADAP